MSLWAARGSLYLNLQSAVGTVWPVTTFLPQSVGSILGVGKDFSPKCLGHFWSTSNLHSKAVVGL